MIDAFCGKRIFPISGTSAYSFYGGIDTSSDMMMESRCRSTFTEIYDISWIFILVPSSFLLASFFTLMLFFVDEHVDGSNESEISEITATFAPIQWTSFRSFVHDVIIAKTCHIVFSSIFINKINWIKKIPLFKDFNKF